MRRGDSAPSVSVISHHHGVPDKSVCVETAMTFNNAADAIAPLDQMTSAPEAMSTAAMPL